MALYGAVLAATSGGAMVAIERALGWSRQLRLTPLSPVAYISVKALVALTLGLGSVLAVNVVGALNGKADMPTHVWIAAAVIAWVCSLVVRARSGCSSATCCPSENVMQVLGPVLAGLAASAGSRSRSTRTPCSATSRRSRRSTASRTWPAGR